jgi:hypothetical protein
LAATTASLRRRWRRSSARSFSAKATTGLGVVMAGLILEFIKFPLGASFGEVPDATMTEFALIAVGAMVGFYLLATLALQNAASVAGLLLTTEVMVAEAPKEEHDHPQMGGGGMGGMGGMDM